MPWPKGDYPPSYKNLPVPLREKAVEIANAILEESGDEGVAIATGLKRAREVIKKQGKNATPKSNSKKRTQK
ncbi:MAG: DUF2188 domain-containing protein [Proteobacteria bacterium]|nr:MAG: DUF2188 domain-containing protein [Pseudomonadota bacterium]